MTDPEMWPDNFRSIRIPFEYAGKTHCCIQITHREWGEANFYGADVPGSVLIEVLLWREDEWISFNGVSIPGHLVPYVIDLLKSMDGLNANSEGRSLFYSSFRQINKIRISGSRELCVSVHRQCFESSDERDDGLRFVSCVRFPSKLASEIASGIETTTRINEIDVLSWYHLNKPEWLDG